MTEQKNKQSKLDMFFHKPTKGDEPPVKKNRLTSSGSIPTMDSDIADETFIDSPTPSTSEKQTYMYESLTESYESIQQASASSGDTRSTDYAKCPYIDPYDLHSTNMQTNLNDDQKSLLLSETTKFKPKPKFTFPKSGNRTYRTCWEDTRPWLRYSEKQDSAFCVYCMCFAYSSESPFVKNGYRNWKKAVGKKESYLDNHSKSVEHNTSYEKLQNFLRCISTPGTNIHAKLDKGAAKTQIRLKKGALSIIDVIIALGERGIPLRGNWVKETQMEDGNFSYFVNWKSKYDDDLGEHLKYASKATRYTSPEFQNEVISLCENEIRQNIISSIPRYWSVIADETQDCSTKEQISICIRYVNEFDNEVCEEFVGFTETERMNAQSIADKILESLEGWGLDMDNLIGQGYDGATVMSSSLNGVQAIIKRRFANAEYVHCRSHVLALTISTSCRCVPEIRNLFNDVGHLTWFLGASAKRAAIFRNIGDDDELCNELLNDNDDEMSTSSATLKEGSKRKFVPKFCATRWTARVETLSALLLKYNRVVESLDQIQEESTGDAKRDAGSYIRLLMDPKVLVSLVVAQFVLSFFACVTKTLQAVNCDLGKAYKDVMLCKEVVKNARCDTTWNKLWERVLTIANANDITIVKPRTSITQRHRSNAGNADQTPSDYYKINVYFAFIDHVIQELETRFAEKHSGLIAAQTLVPSYIDQLTGDHEKLILQYYGKFLQSGEDLLSETAKWIVHCRGIPADARPNDASGALKECDKNYFPAIHRILVIFLTTPVGSVSCERSFSALRRLKLWTRSSMTQDRLSGLAMLLVHRGTARIPTPEAIFAKKTNWRI